MIDRMGDASLRRLGIFKGPAEPVVPPVRVSDSSGRERAEGAPVSAAAEMAAKGAPIDAGKVAAVRQAIAEGRYAVDPLRIADALVEAGFRPDR